MNFNSNNNPFSIKGLSFSQNSLVRYKMLEKVGGGANGDVYKSIRLTDKKVVAVKFLKNTDASSIIRFQNEIQIYQRLKKSPFIVKILDYSLQSAKPYLVMEYCEFGNARNQINYFMNNFEDGIKLLLGAAKGIKQIHSLRTFHRDIKPDNLLFTKNLFGNYILKVGDAGMSCFLPNLSSFFNRTYTLQGTQNYIDPELFQGIKFNAKSDIYSFGVTCHELLTGIQPIAGQIVTRGPAEMQNLIQNMLSISSKSRPNIDEVITGMEMALKQIDNKKFWGNIFASVGLGFALGGIVGIGVELFKGKK